MLNPKMLPKKKIKATPNEEEKMKSIKEEGYEDEDYSKQMEEEEEVDYNTIVDDLFQAKNRLKMEKIQNAVYEDEKVKEHILQLKTGEDAISFFAKYGNTTPIKFLNCIKADPDGKRPYDLTIVHDYQEILKVSEYLTVSPSGIVRVFSQSKRQAIQQMEPVKDQRLLGSFVQTKPKDGQKNEDSTEYISLSDWMKESTQFNIVSNIHFFKHFLLIKMLSFWRSNMKYKKFVKTRQILIKNVFYCKPAFVKSVMESNQIMQEIHTQKMINFDPYVNKPAETEIFKNDQKTLLSKVGVEYNNIYEKIISIIEQVMKHVKDNKNEKLTNDLEKMNFGKQIKQKAIYLQKLEKQEKKLRNKLAKEDFLIKKDYIRLINYMGLENLITSMNTCLNTLLVEITRPDRSSLFKTTANIKNNEVFFSIEDVNIIQDLDTIIDEVIQMLKDLPKILGNSQFDNFRNEYGGPSLKGPEIDSIIKISVEYKNTKEDINAKIRQYFTQCKEFVDKNYSHCFDIEEQRLTFDKEKWKESEQKLQEIESKIYTWKRYKQIKERDIRDHSAGIFQIQGNTIKKELEGFISECLTIFFAKLTDFYYTKGQNTLDALTKINDKLGDKKIEKLKTYCEFIKSLDEARDMKEFLTNEKTEVEKALKLLNQNK